MKAIEFFLPINPPTATHQMKAVRVVNGKPVFYEPPIVKDARAKLTAALAKHAPKEPMQGALRVFVKWCYPLIGEHKDGEYKTTKSDLDNLAKQLLDVMTQLQFWNDDAEISSLILEKFWAVIPGIFIRIDPLEV